MNLPILDSLPPALQEIARPLVQTIVDNPTVAVAVAAAAACLAAWKVLAD